MNQGDNRDQDVARVLRHHVASASLSAFKLLRADASKSNRPTSFRRSWMPVRIGPVDRADRPRIERRGRWSASITAPVLNEAMAQTPRPLCGPSRYWCRAGDSFLNVPEQGRASRSRLDLLEDAIKLRNLGSGSSVRRRPSPHFPGLVGQSSPGPQHPDHRPHRGPHQVRLCCRGLYRESFSSWLAPGNASISHGRGLFFAGVIPVVQRNTFDHSVLEKPLNGRSVPGTRSLPSSPAFLPLYFCSV